MKYTNYSLSKNTYIKARIGWQGLTTAEYLETGNYYLVTGTDIKNGYINFSDCVFVSQNRYSQDVHIQLRLDDVLISKDGTIGKVAYINNLPLPATLNSGVFLIRVDNNVLTQKYFYYLLQSTLFKSFINQTSAGSTITHLYQKDIVKFSFDIPKVIGMQHHIVNIMESVDNVIFSLKRNITKKRNVLEGIIYKYIGAYQNSDSGWNEFTIEKICNVGRGRVINQQEMNNSYSKRYPVYSSQTTNNGIMGYVDTFDFEGDYITWTTDGANAGTIFLRSGKFNCTNVCGTLKLKKEYDINLHFLSLALSINSKKYVSSNLANPKLMNNVMKKIQIWLPKNIKEQEVLSKYINDFNKELNDLEKELEKYESIREGLLNGLFTGKINVPKNYEEV